MKLRASCELAYTPLGHATFLFALHAVPTGGQRILSESFHIVPSVAIEEFTLPEGMNRFTRIQTTQQTPLQLSYQVEVETTHRIVHANTLGRDSPHELPPEVTPYLFPSRYCPSDLLRQSAQEMFGHLTSPHAIAAEVADWIYQNVSYVSGSSDETSSAVDTLQQHRGVCRDFAHLAIAFCRALSIPARYMTCYAARLDPPDFHACFEVFINGWWYLFDATRLAPLNGLIRIATGRDAADVAVCNIFGNTELNSSIVSCDTADGRLIPVTRNSLAARDEAIALL